MSLLITSNLQGEYASLINQDHRGNGQGVGNQINIGTPIQNPASYINHLTNPLRIPPHSEIALQSIKFNRRNLFQIKEGNLFYVYYGLALNDPTGNPEYALDNSLDIPFPVFCRPGTYNSHEFQLELKRALNFSITKPTYWHKQNVDRNANAAWEEFWFVLTANAKGTASTTAKEFVNWRGWDSETSETGGAGKDFTATAVGNTMEIVRNKETGFGPTGDSWTSRNCSITNIDFAMDVVACDTEIDLFETSALDGSARCGFSFTRPVLRNEKPAFFRGRYNSMEVQDDKLVYGDYRIDWNVPIESADGKLRLILSQAVWDDDNDGVVMKEIEYWKGFPGGDNGGDNPVTAKITEDELSPNISTTAGFIGRFRVKIRGSGIALWMKYATSDGMGGTTFSWKRICDTTALDDTDNRLLTAYTWAPINQNKEALYLGCSMFNKDHKITIENMINNQAQNPSTFGGGVAFQYGTEYDETSPETDPVLGSSFWSKCNHMTGGGTHLALMNLARNVEKRVNNQMPVAIPEGFPWKDLDASDEVPENTKVLILQQSANETDATGEGYYFVPGSVGQANMGKMLGFPNHTYVSSESTIGNTKKIDGASAQANPSAYWDFKSQEVPQYLTQSAFVRCPSLTMQSYNMAKSIPSQIIYHLPRSTTDHGNNVFIEPTEKTYIKLRNTDWINLTQFQVDIVTKEETPVKDLSGDTTAVFHIKHQDERTGL